MGFYWTGTGFEERLAPPAPPPPASLASEPQQSAKLGEDASERDASWRPATQDDVQQKIAEAIDKRFPLQSAVRTVDSRKKNDDAGPVRFDPVQGLWRRAEKNPALFPKSAAPPVAIAVDSPRVKAPHEGGSFFRWTSWFRTEAEKGQVLVAPAVEAPETKLRPVTTHEDDSKVFEPLATQHPATPELPTAAADADTSRLEPPLTPPQDMGAPEAQGTMDANCLAAAPSPQPESDPGGSMWQTPKNEHETISKAPGAAGEASHDANPSRWFILKGMLGSAPAPETSEPAGTAPVLEVFSLAGGVGKTSLVATLGRALSARGERVLLVEATPLPSMQYFFGACDCRPGVLRTFKPPVSSGDAPIRLATVDTAERVAGSAGQGLLATEVQRWAEGASRVIVDVGTGSTGTVRELSKTSPAILVPLIPDVNSVVTANAIDSLFQRQLGASGNQTKVFYVLNQFDSSLPLHLDVRNMLQERLSDRLVPLTLERTPAVSEAMAEGMTVMDYAPDARITADFANLAKWLETVLAPAKSNSSGRWSER